MMRGLLFTGLIFLAGFSLPGCVTAPQTREILQHPPHVREKVEIADVPYIEQSVGQCGPATLTMALQWAGHPASIEQIAPEVMTPKKGGTLQEDMISASRREGMMAVRIDGMESLVREIAAGHPVIVFENLGLNWYQQWHYALIYGFDFRNQDLLQHSGHDKADHVDMSVFERSWKLSDYWGLVILPPGEIATAASEIENVKAAAGLEQAAHEDEAALSYHAILERWPKSLGALVGLGNIAYKKKDFKEAVSILKEAQRAHPDSEMVAHNLRVAEAATHNRGKN